MPPRSRFTREVIIQEALALTKQSGIESVTAERWRPGWARWQNTYLACLRTWRAYAVRWYRQQDMAAGEYPPYKASGMAYVRFARQEKELFKLLFMRDRSAEEIGEDRDAFCPILQVIMTNLGISEDDAYRFHLEM